MTPAEKMRLYRRRRKGARVVAPVEVRDVDCSEALIDAGWLPEGSDADREAIGRALGLLFAHLIGPGGPGLPRVTGNAAPRQNLRQTAHAVPKDTRPPRRGPCHANHC